MTRSVTTSLVLLALTACGGNEAPAAPAAPPPVALPTIPTPPAPTPPPAPTLSPDALAGQKSSAIAECANRYGEAVRRVRDRYFESASRERGPRRPTDVPPSIFNWITSDTAGVPRCREAVDRAVAMTPALPDFDQAAAAFITALETVSRVAKDAQLYYERQSFNDDNAARVAPLHAELTSAFDAFDAAERALDTVTHGIEARAVAARLAELEHAPGQRGTFLVERTRACAMQITDAVSNLELRANGRKQRFVSPDGAAFFTQVETCQRHTDEMIAAPETATVDTGGSYRTDARDFVAAALIVARAVRDDTEQASENDARRLTNAVIEEYNAMIGDYNRF